MAKNAPGAGRPVGSGKFGSAPTKAVRIPVHMENEVHDFLLAKGHKLPFVSCTVPAGFPSPAGDYEEQELSLFEHIITNPPATYLMQAKGESMRDCGIMDGAILVVDRSLTPVSGDIVIAEVDGEITVKRLQLKDSQGWLMPENTDFEPMRVDEKEVRIAGVVTWFLNRTRNVRTGKQH